LLLELKKKGYQVKAVTKRGEIWRSLIYSTAKNRLIIKERSRKVWHRQQDPLNIQRTAETAKS